MIKASVATGIAAAVILSLREQRTVVMMKVEKNITAQNKLRRL
jgi:hypothetical protein